MHDFLRSLTNREIAATVWITGSLIALSIFSSKVRRSILNLIKQFFSRAILGVVTLMLLYIFGVVMALRSFGFWDTSLIKDTIFWLSFVALAMLMNASSMLTDAGYFRKAVADCFRVSIFIEFVSNLYSFALWIELIMFPIVLVLLLMLTVAETQKDLAPVKTFLAGLILLFGCISLYFTIHNIVVNPPPLEDKTHLLSLALPVILTFAMLPFIYLFALYMQYESLFLSLSFLEKDPHKIKQAKRTILQRFHFNLRGLHQWAKSGGLLDLINSANHEGQVS